ELEYFVVVPASVRVRAAHPDHGCCPLLVVELLEQRFRFVEPRAGPIEVSDETGGARSTHERVRTVGRSAPGQADACHGSRVPVARPDTDEAPDATEAADELERDRAVAGGQRAGMGFAEVRAIGGSATACLVGHREPANRVQAVRETREVGGVPATGRVGLALALELSLREVADGLQHPVPVLAARIDSMPDQALVEQRLERIEIGLRDGFGRRQRAAPCEDGQTSQDASLALVEE